ncbi:MAG TPA: GNAT family N-acetyltransferase [Gemmatimonadetes bacterium]|jgi:ribosomal protein S18 acetylase RimI-like enzyme|nr:GNAT family N-acetyltransferase [Gemmatimonadota bacterium]
MEVTIIDPSVKKLDLEDQDVLARLLEIEHETFRVHGPLYDISAWGREQFLLPLERKLDFSLLICLSEVVGFSIAYEFRGGWAHISRVAIEPAVAGRGLGKELLTAQLAKLREAGCKTCSIDVRMDNVAATRLYRKLGFERMRDAALIGYVNERGRDPEEYLSTEPSHSAFQLYL